MKKYILILFVAAFFLNEGAHAQTLSSPVANNLTVDPTGASDGTIANPSPNPWYGIRFGSTLSGEGITSPKIGSINVNGLEFKTSYVTRFRLYNSGNAGFSNGNADYISFISSTGNVGINNTTPTAKLHITSNPATAAPIGIFELNPGVPVFPRITLSHSYVSTGNDAKNFIDGSLFYYLSPSNAAAPLIFQSQYGGNVGIGTFSTYGSTTVYDYAPATKLQIQGGALQVTNSGDASTNTTGKTGLLMGHYGNKSSTNTTSYSWIQSTKGPLLLNPMAGNSFTTTNTNNYVAIGFLPTATDLTTLPANGYNLLVQGKIVCEELKVKLKVSGIAWPDYVFVKNYKLMSIDSLSTYIDQNCHLPDVPSTEEVEENGIMAGEMNAILLKKVEELTLYMIEQNKNTTVQAEQIELLKKQNELLMQQVQVLVQNNQTK